MSAAPEAQVFQSGSFIGGEHITSAETYETVNPATGQVAGRVGRADAATVDRAVADARAAQREWRKTTPQQRADLLTAIAARIREAEEELALLESGDTGKPMTQARADAATAARYFEFYGRAVESFSGRTIPLGPDLHAYVTREPYGVTGHIVAWNYPLQLISRAIATSLATGNAAVAKPADETPRSTVRLAELLIEAGAPAGVFNVVTGLGAETGAALANHPGIDHLGFVGSTQTGSAIAHAAAERVIPTVLELGGKSANIVFEDADLEAALPQIRRSIIQNAGQTCSAGARLLVHESIHAELVERLAETLRTVTIGPGSEDPELGPLISAKQLERVHGFFAELDPAQIVCGGGTPEGLDAGSFIQPTIVDHVDPESRIAQEEVFGPVVAVMPFRDEAHAIELAESTPYGLVSAVWTRDLSRAHRVTQGVQAGQIFVNTYGAGGGVELPFGGFGKSGYGREKGLEALEEYSEAKTVVIKL